MPSISFSAVTQIFYECGLIVIICVKSFVNRITISLLQYCNQELNGPYKFNKYNDYHAQ
jgi:hypothetical protein